MKSSVSQIRLRLLSLLGRAFVTVLFLSLLLFLGSAAYVVTSYPQTAAFRFPIIGRLEGYYLGHGSWDGVEVVFRNPSDIPPEYLLLLDKDDRVILDGGQVSGSTVGSIYDSTRHNARLVMEVDGEKIGTLVVRAMPFALRGRIASGILLPIGVISLILAIFLVVAATLLMRRFVNPLADVIYAARSVADGNLGTRVAVNGPQDLRALNESFNEMASALERDDRQRRALLTDIAHELRTPLSVIRGRLEGIVDGIYSADGGQVSLALEQTYLLERLVDDLRLLTLAETRQLHFEKKPVDLAQLAEHTIELFAAEASEKDISLSLEKGSGNFVAGLDSQRTEQVIGNMVGNALRYIPEGSRVWLTLAETSDGVQLSVNDNGPGVASEDLPNLFDRFWRKDKSRARASGGTGLGLAIAKQLVEAQGGTIEARNRPEGGLQVVVEFK
ncbi:MAG: ATP-binding protein [Chloroflexota bacterium]